MSFAKHMLACVVLLHVPMSYVFGYFSQLYKLMNHQSIVFAIPHPLCVSIFALGLLGCCQLAQVQDILCT